MTYPQRVAAPSEHERHDLAIVATLAARPADLDESEETAARAQIASCRACADALADFVALQTALPATATPRRPRDFQLTPADAQRIQRSGWRRLLGYFGSARDGFSRPLAIGLTTLGLAGLMLATIPSATLIGGSGGAAPANEAAPIQQAAPAPATSVSGTDRSALGAAPPVPALPSGAPSASAEAVASASTGAGTASTEAASASTDMQVFTGGNPDEVAPDISGGADSGLRDGGGGFSGLFVVGAVLLIAGLGLFALRWSARRLS